MMNREHICPTDAELATTLLDVLEDELRYGATLQTAHLRSLVGLGDDARETNLLWLSVCEIFKARLLRDHRMYLRSVGSGSYAIIDPRQQVQVAGEDEVWAIYRAISRADEIVAYTNTDDFNDAEMRKHDDLAADRAARAQLFRRELRRRRRE